jgi:dihydrofolate reductase
MTKPRIALVVAVAENGVIGRDNKLPWRIREDVRWFKEKTMGKPCIVGRKTYESFPKRPLPGRTNIVVTRDRAYRAEGAVVVHSLEAALEAASRETPEEIAIIGGTELYLQALPIADRIYLTSVHGAFEGDTTFPAIEASQWRETIVGVYPPSPERPIGYSFIILDRK